MGLLGGFSTRLARMYSVSSSRWPKYIITIYVDAENEAFLFILRQVGPEVFLKKTLFELIWS